MTTQPLDIYEPCEAFVAELKGVEPCCLTCKNLYFTEKFSCLVLIGRIKEAEDDGYLKPENR